VSKIIKSTFGDNLDFKHPVCGACRGNTFTVEISENDDIILNCVRCTNRIDFDLGWKTSCDHFRDMSIKLESELEECKCIKSSYFDTSLKCQQQNERLESRVRELEAERDRLRENISTLLAQRKEAQHKSISAMMEVATLRARHAALVEAASKCIPKPGIIAISIEESERIISELKAALAEVK